jgi:hypothetical protein
MKKHMKTIVLIILGLIFLSKMSELDGNLLDNLFKGQASILVVLLGIYAIKELLNDIKK